MCHISSHVTLGKSLPLFRFWLLLLSVKIVCVHLQSFQLLLHASPLNVGLMLCCCRVERTWGLSVWLCHSQCDLHKVFPLPKYGLLWDRGDTMNPEAFLEALCKCIEMMPWGYQVSGDQGSVWEGWDLGQHLRQEAPNLSSASNLVNFFWYC